MLVMANVSGERHIRRTEGEADMGQPVAWFEIISPDAERAKKFYSELFGWKVDSDPQMGGYALVDPQAGEGAVAGGIGPAEPGSGPGVKIYMRVDDIDAYLERA